MQREFLKGLDLGDEAIDKIMTEHGKSTNNLKAQLHTAESERDGYKSQVEDRDTQITQLKDANKDNNELQTQITDLQAQIQAKDTEAADALTATKTDYEIQLALQSAGAKNVKSVLPHLDREKLALNEKGELTGLTEQLETVQKDFDYLFQTSGPPNGEPGKPNITPPGNPDPTTPPPNEADAFYNAWNPK